MVEAVGDVTAVFKPQVAYFERFGWQGLKAVDEVLRHARSADALTIADVKRMDIGSTLEAYAAAWLGEDAGIRADAITLGAYMGAGSLKPVVERAATVAPGSSSWYARPTRTASPCRTPATTTTAPSPRLFSDDITAFNAARLDPHGLGPSAPWSARPWTMPTRCSNG